MQTSKYTDETLEILLAEIANGEHIGYCCEQAGISTDSFYKWQRSKPEFKEMVKKAKDEFRKSAPRKLKVIARQRLKDMILNGNIIKGAKETIIESAERDEDGNLIKWVPLRRITEHTETNLGVPQYAYDRIIPLVPDLQTAFNVIRNHGYQIIIDPDHMDKHRELLQLQAEQNGDQESVKALTPEEYNAIRAKILGVQEDATDITEVSAVVDD